MARKFLTAIDLAKNELQNAAVQNLASAPASPVKGQLYFNSTGGDNTLYWWDGTAWIPAKSAGGAFPGYGSVPAETTFGITKNDGVATTVARSDHTHGSPTHDNAAHSAINISALAAPISDVSWGGFSIIGLATPSQTNAAATKQYVDNAIAGLAWKDSVRVATTTNGTLASAFANGQVVDGVTLATGNRILLKNQSTGTENGIYTVNASGAPTRAVDADATGEMDGAAVFVEEGTSQADTVWVQTATGPIIPGTTATTWAQFSGASAATAGAGLTATGNVLAVGAGTGITVNADNVALTVPVDVTSGGTGRVTSTTAYGVLAAGTTATGAHQTVSPGTSGQFLKSAGAAALPAFAAIAQSDVTNLVNDLGLKFTRYILASVGGSTSQVINHNFNTRYVIVNLFRATTPWDTVECDVERTDMNNVTLRFTTAPTGGEYSVVVAG